MDEDLRVYSIYKLDKLILYENSHINRIEIFGFQVKD